MPSHKSLLKMSACENKLDEIASCFVCRKTLEGKGSGKCSKCKL